MKVTSKALKTVLQGGGSGIGGGDAVIPPNPQPKRDPEAPLATTQKGICGTTKANPGSERDLELGTDILKDNQPPEEAISFEREDEQREKDGEGNKIENEAEPSRDETNGRAAAAQTVSNSGEADETSASSPASPPPPPAPTNGVTARGSCEDETPGFSPTPPPSQPKEEKLDDGSRNEPSGSSPPPPPGPRKRKPAQAKKVDNGGVDATSGSSPTPRPPPPSNPPNGGTKRETSNADSERSASGSKQKQTPHREQPPGGEETAPTDWNGGCGASGRAPTEPPVNPEQWTKLLSETTKSRRDAFFKLSQHKLASQCLFACQTWYIATPIAVLTTISGILAFVAGSALLDDSSLDTSAILNITVGVMSFVAVFIQTVSGRLNFDARGEMHGSTAYDLRALYSEYSDLSMTLSNDKRLHIIPTQRAVEDVAKALENMRNRKRQCLEKCKSIVPDKIFNAFHILDDELSETFEVGGFDSTVLEKAYGSDYKHKIYVQACTDLSEKLHSHWSYPICLPNSRKIVDTIIEEHQSKIKNAKIRREAIETYLSSSADNSSV
jgi:hypothetical protein